MHAPPQKKFREIQKKISGKENLFSEETEG